MSWEGDTGRYALHVVPAVSVLSWRTACELEVFVKPPCKMVLDDKALLANQENGVLESTIVPTGLKAVTELTTALHYDDIVCAKLNGEWSFRTVFK